ncbi:probable galacturonosyltransferase 15 isoform X2 [Magnolia sinica]|uniref:probable galacturonosyltransferase 15 isoform X2 n=1 Tax=Magnolia sinica TaxID=86752 RepID=UPI0026594ABA|nr:probable galacturonosyltransferase 15 isoform X2 [Magnolia sinica]
MHFYISSGGAKRVTISKGGGCFWKVMKVMKVKGSNRRFSYRSVLPTVIIAAVLLPFLFIRTAFLALESASHCSSTTNCIGWRLWPGFFREGDTSMMTSRPGALHTYRPSKTPQMHLTRRLGDEMKRAFIEAKEEEATDTSSFLSFNDLVADVTSSPQKDIKTFVSKTKLLKMDRAMELARLKGSIYRHLASIGVPKSMYCLSLRLAEEYSINARARSPLLEVESISRLTNNSYHHIAVLTDNILAASVVVSSAVKSCGQPEKMVFHVITDKKTYAPMHAWFALNPVGPATVEVKGLHQYESATDLNKGLLEVMEIYRSMREHYYQHGGGIGGYGRLEVLRPSCFSLLNHLRIYLPKLFPELEKMIFLDDDVVVQRDLSPLWGLDLNGKVNGAVSSWDGDDGRKRCFGGRFADHLNFSDPIISSGFEHDRCAWLDGMHVFDLQAWRGTHITQNYLRWLKINQDSGFTLWHLGALPPALLAFDGHMHRIDPSWHLSGLGHQQSDVDRGMLKAAAVIHFSGPAKPWLEIGSPKLRSLWTTHVNFSSEYVQSCRLM